MACIASATATPKLIYSDANPVGAFELDPWGDIFFVDGNNSKTKATNLNEIPLTAGTYAASPTLVESYTNAAGYGNGISGLSQFPALAPCTSPSTATASLQFPIRSRAAPRRA